MKKTTAMMAASLMIMSLVLGGCGTTSAASATTAAIETEAETQVQTETAQADAAQDSAAQADAAQDSNMQTDAAQDSNAQADTTASSTTAKIPSADEIEITETIENSTDEEHAITADGEEASYSNIAVVKTGDADGDEADFYGANAAIFATNGGTLDLTEITVNTDGKHANGVFSYGEGTTVLRRGHYGHDFRFGDRDQRQLLGRPDDHRRRHDERQQPDDPYYRQQLSGHPL